MTEEELEKESEEYASNLLKDVNCTLGNPRARQINSIDIQDAYLAGAEPREKQITGLSKHILELQKDKCNLIDRVRELEQQIEKMKCCGNCIHCKYDENEESYEYCEKHQQVVNIAVVPCSEYERR